MRRAAFPFFALALASQYILTLLQLGVFLIFKKKYLFINLLLTALLALLCFLWLKLPPAMPQDIPELPLSPGAEPAITPRGFLVETDVLPQNFRQYQKIKKGNVFISQAEYINLALMAHAAGEYEMAEDFLRAAQYIDPNREFFLN